MGSRQVVVVGYDGAELVDIACVTTAFEEANRLGAEPAYSVVLATVGGADIRCETRLILRVQGALTAIRSVDTLIISGGRGVVLAANGKELIRQVRRLAEQSRRVASVCTGAAVLAEAGLLDGRRAATHWEYAKRFAAQYPSVSVDSAPIFIRDGHISTSAGVTASLDLTLAFIEEDHGAELARWVAMAMVTYLQRPGNQSQMSVFTSSPQPDHATVREVMDHVVACPDTDLSVEALALRAGVSGRHLTRLFQEHVGEPPAAVVRGVRLEVAARLTSTTDLPLEMVARRCGFSSAETLRQAFVTKFGVSPRTFRQTQVRVRSSTGS